MLWGSQVVAPDKSDVTGTVNKGHILENAPELLRDVCISPACFMYL
jgi:hypothetical protein